VRQALDVGITTFETADAYAATKAESVLGEALKGERRGGLEIFTKVYFPMGSPVRTTTACRASTSTSRSTARYVTSARTT
jgi:aryl-alcohol dehydrogenase-like predicted oxidoreductase